MTATPEQQIENLKAERALYRSQVALLRRSLRFWARHGDHCLAGMGDRTPCECGLSYELEALNA